MSTRAELAAWTPFSAAFAPIFLIGGWTLGAAQQREFDARVQTISALAALDARERWIMTSALVGLGVCHIGSALGLRAAGRAGRVVLALGGVFTVLVAAFPLAPGTSGRAHVLVASCAFSCLALWPVLALRRGQGTPFALRPLVSAFASAVLLGLLGLLGWALEQATCVGLAERLAAGAEALWPWLVTASLRRKE